MNRKSILIAVLAIFTFLTTVPERVRADIIDGTMSLDQYAMRTTQSGDVNSNGDSLNGLDFWVANTDTSSAGTGQIETFLTIDEVPDPNNPGQTWSRGYNYDGQIATTLPGNSLPEYNEVEQAAPLKLKPLPVSEVPTGSFTNFAGDLGDNFGEIILDINEAGGSSSEMSVVQLQIFAVTEAYAFSDLSQFTTDSTFSSQYNTYEITLIDFADDPSTVGLIDAVEIFRLSDVMEDFEIQLNAALQQGGGAFDMRFFFDLDLYEMLDPDIYTNFIVFTQFQNVEAGPDEWAVITDPSKSSFIPEPSTWALLMMTAAGALFFQYRQQRKQKLATADAEGC